MKRIFSMLMILCVFFTTVFPMTAYATDADPALGISDSEAAPLDEDAPEETPTDIVVEIPEEVPADVPEETPAEIPADILDETPEETPQISLFSDFTDGDNEFYTRVRLTVTDRQGNPLSGVVYGLYTMGGLLVEYLTTDSYGAATSGEVPVDTDYYLQEITAPTGYAPNTGRKEIILTEICAPSLVDIIAEYDPIMGRIKVIKTDESGSPLSGVGFYVYRSDTGALADTILTGADGTAVTAELPYGWYELYEYLVPQGYESDGYYMAMIETEGETAEVYITNYRSRAYVRVNKTGNDDRKIQGAVFSVYDADTNEWMEDITTNSSGYAYSSSLVLGEYYLVEKSVPAGYQLDDTPRYFTLDSAWQTVYLDIVNDRSGESGKVKIVKTDDSENPLSGVVFGLYRVWDGKKLAELTTGEDGTVTSDLLIPQDYYLVELSGKDGYTMITAQIPFTIDESGTTVVVVAINPKARIFGKVKVIKQDEDGNPLSGVRFGLYCHKDNLLQEMITREDGTAVSGILNEGTGYYIKELSGLPGYISNEQQYTFDISENNVIVPVTVVNPRITGGVKVIKTSEDGEPLSGVVFGIYQDNTLVQELATGADGTAESDALYYGSYELRELATADGYELLTAAVPFSILEQGVIIEIPVTNPLIIGGVNIYKTDESGTPLSGAVFGLYNEQEQLIAELTTDEDGRAESGNLVMGRYYLREHTAPEGFAAAEGDISFAITAQGEIIEKTIVNSVGYGTLRVIKYGEGESAQTDEITPVALSFYDEPLSGVVFEVYRESDNEKIAEIVTDEYGVAEIELPLGGYYLMETQTAKGYMLPEGGFSFALTEHGATVELSIRNQREPESEDGAVRLVKLAEGTGEPLPGAVFGVYDADSGEKLAVLITGADGAAELALPEGGYYLIEQTAPDGFILGESRIDFTVRSGETAELTVTNKPIPADEPDPAVTGFIRLIKKVEGTGALLSGAVFGVYETATDVKVAELTTGTDGTATSDALPAGAYYLLERTAPSGYKLNTDKNGVTVKAGETVEITVYNTVQSTDSGDDDDDDDDTGRLRLIKEAADTGERLSGAVFGIYRTSNNRKVAEITTGSNGTVSYELDAGRYYLLELEAPEGFILDSDEISFTISADATKTVTVTNEPEDADAGYVRVIKKDEGTGERLSGAVFGIYKASNDRKIAEITTGTNGTAAYKLDAGRYYLLELEAPSGYKLKTDKVSFTVKTGETKEVTVLNTPKESGDPVTGNLHLIKEAAGTGAKLPSAVFGVYRSSDDEMIAELTTDSNGKATAELPAGEYYLKELAAPAGYELCADKFGVTVTADKTVEITVTNEKTPDTASTTDPTPTTTPASPSATTPTGKLLIIKKAAQTGNPLSGAVFGVYSASDNKKITELTTNTDGKATLALSPGEYYLKEISAPYGYLLEPAKIYFTVTAGVTVTAEVTNIRDESIPDSDMPDGTITIPKTGGDFPAANYIFAVFLWGIAVLCGILMYRGRKMKMS